MREGAEVLRPNIVEHTFYWGIHPVSWFILIVNVSLGVFEWTYIIYNMCFRTKQVADEEEKGERGDTEEEDDDDE